jgi:hypothetical protein
MRAKVFAIAAFVVSAGPALADGPVATAGGSGPGAPQPTTPAAALPPDGTTSAQSQPVAMGPCGPEKVKPDGRLDTAAHGELEAGVGTGGYRHVAGAVCQPVGQDGAVAVSVSVTEAGQGHRRH